MHDRDPHPPGMRKRDRQPGKSLCHQRSFKLSGDDFPRVGRRTAGHADIRSSLRRHPASQEIRAGMRHGEARRSTMLGTREPLRGDDAVRARAFGHVGNGKRKVGTETCRVNARVITVAGLHGSGSTSIFAAAVVPSATSRSLSRRTRKTPAWTSKATIAKRRPGRRSC